MKLKVTVIALIAGLFLIGAAFAQQSGTSGSSSDSGMTSGTQSGSSGAGGEMTGTQGQKEQKATKEQGGIGSAQAGTSKAEIKQVQQALKEKGQNPGKIDGKMGPKTESALRSFQKQQGLQATGKIDQKTLAALGVSGAKGATGGGGAGTGGAESGGAGVGGAGTGGSSQSSESGSSSGTGSSSSGQ